MDFIDLLRLSYLGAALGVLLVTVTPPLGSRFLAYGPRASPSARTATPKDEDSGKGHSAPNVLSQCLEYVAECQVPHNYFVTFYVFSTSLSAFWLLEILYSGPTFRAIARWTQPRSASISVERIEVAWAMMLVQGSRRLYECLVATTESKGKERSKMHVLHWVLGLLFYQATNIAVWIEGTPVLQSHEFSLYNVAFRAPALRTIFSILIFILASGIQHDCHTYLADLKSSKVKSEDAGDGKAGEGDYKIPTHPAFQSLIAPHYTAECLIYFSLAVVAAPEGAWLNWTLTSALVFVVANLGVTAAGTREWYEKRFGYQAVEGKWNIIPLIY